MPTSSYSSSTTWQSNRLLDLVKNKLKLYSVFIYKGKVCQSSSFWSPYHTILDENDKIIAEVKGSALLCFSKNDDYKIKMSNENNGDFYFNNSIPINNKILTNGIKCMFLKVQKPKNY